VAHPIRSAELFCEVEPAAARGDFPLAGIAPDLAGTDPPGRV